jgi:hypothetical protein
MFGGDLQVISPKVKFIVFPILTLLLFICRNLLHYVLLLYDCEIIADFLVFPNESGILFDALLGIFFYIIDRYGLGNNHRKNRTLRHLFQVFLIFTVLLLGLCIFPYSIVNESFGEKILSPIFSLFIQSGLLDRVKNMDVEMLRATFYWHFFLQESTFIEWIVTYLVFQSCTLISKHLTTCLEN